MKKKVKNFLQKLFYKQAKNEFLHKRNTLEISIKYVITNNIVGDYLEFGVLRGESFIFVYHNFKKRFKKYLSWYSNKPKNEFMEQKARFFAFDSFEGFPEHDDTETPAHWKGEGAFSYPRQLFQENLKAAKVRSEDIGIIEGYYDDTLSQSTYEKHQISKAAMIHIDCDLYESTVSVLNNIKPLIQDGTVVIFDDYFFYKGSPYKGERGAFNQWLNDNPDLMATELVKYYPSAAFIINFKDPESTFKVII